MGIFAFLSGLGRMAVTYINISIAAALAILVLLLARPLLRRALDPQRRVILWAVTWIPAYLGTWYGAGSMLKILPFGFRDLIVPRVSLVQTGGTPAYLPDYGGPGVYNIAFPGGASIQVEWNDTVMAVIGAVWIIGVLLMGWFQWKQYMAVRHMANSGTLIPERDPVLEEMRNMADLGLGEVEVRMCEDIPTSFVFRGRVEGPKSVSHTICLQRELSPQRLPLVLFHEVQHTKLRHCYVKYMMALGLVLHWFNPVMWLAWRYACQDMELACDRATLRKLDEKHRREYAHTLLEAAAGRNLWESSMCFGECDAEVRVREVVRWKPAAYWKTGLTMALTVLLALFFLQGPMERILPQDFLLFWENTPREEQVLELAAQREIRTIDPESAGVKELWLETDSNLLLYAQLMDGSWWRVGGYLGYTYRWGTIVRLEGAAPIKAEPDLSGSVRLEQ